MKKIETEVSRLAKTFNNNVEIMESLEDIILHLRENNSAIKEKIAELKKENSSGEKTGTGLTITVELLEKYLDEIDSKGRNRYYRIPDNNLMLLHIENNQCVVTDYALENKKGCVELVNRALKKREFYIKDTGDEDQVVCIESSLGEKILGITDGEEETFREFLVGKEVRLLGEKWDYRRDNLWMGYENSLKYDKDENIVIHNEEELMNFIEKITEKEEE